MTEQRGEEAKPAGGSRRSHVCVVFSDLSDSTMLAAGMEAELYRELLTSVRQACRTIISRHGGTIARIQGDGLLALFGYPQANEDAGRRATEAALELHEAIHGLDVPGMHPATHSLSLHTGIHAGLVLLDDGDLERGRFELVGDAPNVAARLSGLAQHDEILVSEATLGPAAHFFRLGPRRLLAVRGKEATLPSFQVLGRAPVHSRFEARMRQGLAPFVGRDMQLSRLGRALEDARAGAVVTLAVCAAAGVGKTRLIEEFIAHAANGRALHRGYCESYLSAEPLQPLLQMLRSLCGMTRGMTAAEAAAALDAALAAIDPALLAHRTELLRLLSVTVTVVQAGDTPRPAGEAVNAALTELFAALALQRPLVLFIDDWQWADDATRQWLRTLRARSTLPILVLLSTRGFDEGDADVNGVRIVELEPLNDDEASQTIARLLPRADPFIAAEIQRHAGGNPLFIEELCHSAAAEAETGQRSRLDRPPASAAWLDSLIESRLARLPAAQAELVRIAAVVGNVVPAWLLETLTGRTEDDPLLRGLAEQDFIFPGREAGTLRFKHGITRDAVYDSVGLHARRAMHLRIATALRGPGDAPAPDDAIEALAYHYGAADQPREAAQHAELAGDKALATSALDRAQYQYSAALAALDRLPPSHAHYQRWSSILRRFGMACIYDPSREQLKVFRRANALATAYADPFGVVQAEYWLGYIHYGLGQSGPAIEHCERALQAAGSAVDEAQIGQLKAVLGQARAAAGDYETALELLDEALAIKRGQRKGIRPAVSIAYTLACKAQVLGDWGTFAEAHACFDEALSVVRGANHEVEASVLCLRCLVLLWQGRWSEAGESATQAQRISHRVRSLYVYAMSRALGGFAQWKGERRETALQAMIDATAWLESRDNRLFTSLNHGYLAEALVDCGRIAEARVYAGRALRRARQRDRLGESMACRAMASAAAQGHGHGHKTAQHYIARALQSASLRGSLHDTALTRLCAAQIEMRAGHRDTALALIDEASAAFEVLHMDWHLAQAARLREAA